LTLAGAIQAVFFDTRNVEIPGVPMDIWILVSFSVISFQYNRTLPVLMILDGRGYVMLLSCCNAVISATAAFDPAAFDPRV